VFFMWLLNIMTRDRDGFIDSPLPLSRAGKSEDNSRVAGPSLPGVDEQVPQ